MRSQFNAFIRTARTQGVLTRLEILLGRLTQMYWKPLFEALEPLTRLRDRCHVVFVTAVKEMVSDFLRFLEK